MNKSGYDNAIRAMCGDLERDYRFIGIRERGYDIERMTPFYGKHHYKYSFALNNGQEIIFRGYHRDSIESLSPIISPIIHSFDAILSICSGKIRFEEQEVVFPFDVNEVPTVLGPVATIGFHMEYFTGEESYELNGLFLTQYDKDDYYYKLVSNPQIKKYYSHIYFRRNEKVGVEMLYNFGLSWKMVSHWNYCRDKAMLHYELRLDKRYLDTATGFFVIPLKPIINEEQLNTTINIICDFILKNKQINDAFPGERFFPDIFFKIYPHKLKCKNVVNQQQQSKVIQSDNIVSYSVGDKVIHESFGVGVVTQVINEKGRVIVDFENLGEKTLVCLLAKMKKAE